MVLYKIDNALKLRELVVGNFGEDVFNDKSERLNYVHKHSIELCTQTSLKIWNGCFNN